jgi:excisionase family DNA binding protein
MILFKDPKYIVDFLGKNLPPKLIDELFFDYNKFEHKGETRQQKTLKKPFFIIEELRKKGFVYGLTEDVNNLFMPEKYVLLWTKLKSFVDTNQTLTVEQSNLSLLTINNACKFLGVTRPTLYKILRENQIPTVEVLSQKRIQLKDLLDFIDSNKKRRIL